MDIHNYKRRPDRTLERIKESKEVSTKNKEIILNFHDSCFAEDLSVCKIEKYLYDLFNFTQMLNKDLSKTDKQDLQKIVAEFNRLEEESEDEESCE